MLIAGVVFAVRELRPRQRFVIAFAPLGPSQVVLVTRYNDDRASYRWLQLDDASGAVRWIFDTGTHSVPDYL